MRRARDLGFTIDEVRELLSLSDQKDRSCEAVNAIARQHVADVDRKIADLTALPRELDSVIGQCGCGTIAEAASSKRFRVYRVPRSAGKPKHGSSA